MSAERPRHLAVLPFWDLENRLDGPKSWRCDTQIERGVSWGTSALRIFQPTNLAVMLLELGVVGRDA